MGSSYRHIQVLAKCICLGALAGTVIFGFLHLLPTADTPLLVEEYKLILQERFERKIYGAVEPSRTAPQERLPEKPGKDTDGHDRGKQEASDTPSASVPMTKQSKSDLLTLRSGYLSFPPSGEFLGEFSAKIFYPIQKRYADVAVKLMINPKGVYLYGAAMCEADRDGKIVLLPCIFMQEIPFTLYSHELVSPLEQELSTAIQISKELEFYPWARYATSHLECTENSGKFRISIQFGNTAKDVFISLAVPYSHSEINALFDLADRSAAPCSGLEIFFTTQDLMEIILRAVQAKNKFATGELTVEERNDSGND